jgi:predicted metalloprotease with PDZ domain
MEFIFDPETDIVRNPKEYMGSYGYDDYDQFHEEVIAMRGEEIVKMTKVLTGYYDITFAGGHILHAISAHSIMMQPV